ncbi:AAA family ATPase [Altererythrobacter sp. SALINAS58]|uniref:AAA family ATPase n=1 Tax=Alteripontixanthobacter muriae TaxID=2705546 RepID=UPI001574F00B|nr:AAA family ATPase [Alteripontixanthobacter muriae]
MTTACPGGSGDAPAQDPNAISGFLAPIGAGIHLAAIPADGGPPSGKYFGDDIGAATTFALERNVAGENVYFTPNEPAADCGNKPTKAQIRRVRAVFVDIDPPSGGEAFDKAAICAEIQRDAPTVLIDSGNGIQAFWFFDHPIDAVPEAIATCEEINKALVVRYGGDPAATNADRLMRLPGTMNWPNARKRERGRVPRAAQVLSPDSGQARPTVFQLQAHFGSRPSAEGARKPGPSKPEPSVVAHLRSALGAIPAQCGYDYWVRIGCALKDLGDAGRDLFLHWSYSSPEVEPGVPEAKWEQLSADRTGYRVVFVEAQRHGWVNPRSASSRNDSGTSKDRGSGGAFTEQYGGVWPQPVAIGRDEWLVSRTSPDAIITRLIYADVGTMIAAGGTGKTTLALWLAIHIVLGIDFCGRPVTKPGRVALLTGEDSREILVARLNMLITAMFSHEFQTEADRQAIVDAVRDGIIIMDVSADVVRLTCVDRDVVKVDLVAVDALAASLAPFELSLLIIDPAVSFGVGEGRVNDAEQGLIQAARRLRQLLACAVFYVHHTGKANAREKTEDQYSGRGGSALSDGSRMVFVINRPKATDWLKQTGVALAQDETGLKISIAKLSYCEPQKELYVVRKGYAFRFLEAGAPTEEEGDRADEDTVLRFLSDEIIKGITHSQKTLSDVPGRLGLSRDRLRSIVRRLLDSSALVEQRDPGKSNALIPATLAATDRPASLK